MNSGGAVALFKKMAKNVTFCVFSSVNCIFFSLLRKLNEHTSRSAFETRKTGRKNNMKRIFLKPFKIAILVFGILLAFAGGTFALQGLGDLGTGSFMDSNPSWIYIGSFLLVIGPVLVALSLYRKSNM